MSIIYFIRIKIFNLKNPLPILKQKTIRAESFGDFQNVDIAELSFNSNLFKHLKVYMTFITNS